VKVRWLDEAVRELISLRRYIAENDPDAARKVAARILDAALVLDDYPAAGRAGRVPNTRELLIPGTPYILPYRVRADVVEILRVLHGARK
jgi:toxin ParE1/3/4